jgi:hypothetical protein
MSTLELIGAVIAALFLPGPTIAFAALLIAHHMGAF